MTDLTGRVAVVTGTAHGIGSGIADALAAHGATVHGCDRDTVDVTDAGQVADFVAAIGRVDILVNNAGGVVGQVGRPLEEVSDDDWRAVVDANLTSTFVCTRAVAPGHEGAPLRTDRQHLVGRRAQRQPDRDPGVREREGRARSASRGRRRTSSGSTASPSTRSHPASCSRTRPRSPSTRATARRVSDGS